MQVQVVFRWKFIGLLANKIPIADFIGWLRVFWADLVFDLPNLLAGICDLRFENVIWARF